MPASKEAGLLPSPWREFLAELDGRLDHTRAYEQVLATEFGAGAEITCLQADLNEAARGRTLRVRRTGT